MTWSKRIVHIGERRNVYLREKTEWTRKHGRPRRSWEIILKRTLKKQYERV